jgi:hypothetical protein
MMRDDDFRQCIAAAGQRMASNYRVAPIAKRMLDDFGALVEADARP